MMAMTQTRNTHWLQGSSISTLVPGPHSASCLGVVRSENECSNTRIRGLAPPSSTPPVCVAYELVLGGACNPTSFDRAHAPECPGGGQMRATRSRSLPGQGVIRGRGLKMGRRGSTRPSSQNGIWTYEFQNWWILILDPDSSEDSRVVQPPELSGRTRDVNFPTSRQPGSRPRRTDVR